MILNVPRIMKKVHTRRDSMVLDIQRKVTDVAFHSLDLIHMVVRGLLKEHYCKAFVKIRKVR